MKHHFPILFIALCIVAFISIGFNYYLIHELDERDLYCDKIMKEYEESVVPFNAKRAEYLAVTSGVDENSTEEEILAGIIEGIHEEIETYKY